MSRKSVGIGLGLLIVMGLAFGYAGWRVIRSHSQQTCDICGRALHVNSRAIGTVDGRPQTHCCLACGLTAHKQTGRPVEITELADFESNESVDPQDAYLVVGSAVNLCMRHQTLLDDVKKASPMKFDRCSPSVLAFAEKSDAENFITLNSGTLMTFEELGKAYR